MKAQDDEEAYGVLPFERKGREPANGTLLAERFGSSEAGIDEHLNKNEDATESTKTFKAAGTAKPARRSRLFLHDLALPWALRRRQWFRAWCWPRSEPRGGSPSAVGVSTRYGGC